MSIVRILLSLCVLCLLASAAEFQSVAPPDGAKPVGPYSPGVLAGKYLYVSGQGAKKANGDMSSSFDEQVRQTLENVKGVLKAAGLTMDNVVYTQVYLEDMAHFDAMNRVYASYFPQAPPARATLGVAKLPGGTPVEINAVAVRDVSEKKVVAIPGFTMNEPVSPGVLTNDRLFISAIHRTFSDPEKDVEAALDGMKAVVQAAGLSMAHVVFVNPYLTTQMPSKVMNTAYAKRFEFGNTPARATIEASSLPGKAAIEFTGVAVRDLQDRKAIRPKNMPPSPTASPCVFAGDTLYCSAKSGFVPGPVSGVFTPALDLQARQTMRNLLDNLEEAGLTYKDVVATNIYLDDLADFAAMNSIYAKFFSGVLPARTTVQQIAPVQRGKKESGDTYPEIEQVSLIAVRAGS